MEYELSAGLAELRKAEKRKFVQTIDLTIILSGIDVKKPENKFSKDVLLPHGTGRDMTVGVIAEANGIGKDDIEALERDKKAMKQFIRKYDVFVCEPKLMALVGKVLGRYLGPRGKMPKLLPPNRDPATVINEVKSSVLIRIRDAPMVQVAVGTEAMPDEHLVENAKRVLEEIKKSLPGKGQIKHIYLKTTMGKPIEIKR